MEATRVTLEFSTRPMKAMTLANSSSSRKSKVNCFTTTRTTTITD
jgi:hypothetical protein